MEYSAGQSIHLFVQYADCVGLHSEFEVTCISADTFSENSSVCIGRMGSSGMAEQW